MITTEQIILNVKLQYEFDFSSLIKTKLISLDNKSVKIYFLKTVIFISYILLKETVPGSFQILTSAVTDSSIFLGNFSDIKMKRFLDHI